MRIRAAVLEEFGAPLWCMRWDLAEPQGGEVLVRLVACGVCHTDLYTASARNLGVCAGGARPRGRGSRREGRRRLGVSSVGPGDHVVTFSRHGAANASTAWMNGRICAWRFASSRTRVPCPTGRPGSRATDEPIRHFMGTSTFAEHIVMPEIALATITPEAPLSEACVFACGLLDRARRRAEHGKGAAGSTCVSSAPASSARGGGRVPAGGR